jgi:hypothetical protein
MGNNWTNQGDANAASTLAQNNAWLGALNNGVNWWDRNNFINGGY